MRIEPVFSLRKKLNKRCEVLDNSALKKSAIVFVPHQDDETLGCGATIYRKIAAGADVYVVFLTDGSRSHSKFLKEAEVKSLRAKEALMATSILGVEESKVIFLEYYENDFHVFQNKAVESVKKIIMEICPEQIYMPFYKDVHKDHIMTNLIVKRALRDLQKSIDVFEFPIWFWSHWPWIGINVKLGRLFLKEFKKSLTFHFGLTAFKYFKYRVDVPTGLQEKQAALNAYTSQMTKMNSQKDWPVLGEVADGDFLKCFFCENEIFYKYKYVVQ